MAKPVVANKRFSLNNLIEGWTDEQYIVYRPFSYAEIDRIKAMETTADGVSGFTQMLKEHFISGAWLVSDDDGTNVRTEPMEVEDVLDLPVEVTNAWLKVAMGNVDPKQKAN
jgi:hypothetical protein